SLLPRHQSGSCGQPSWTPATRPIVTGQRRASDSRAFYSQRTPKPPPPTSAKIDAAASIEQAPPKPSVFDPPSPVSDLNPRRVPPPTPPFHFLIRPFVVEALTNVHPAASDPQISTARAASLNASKDMAKQRQLFSTHDASPRSFKSREWDSMSRWSEYISLEELSSSTPMNGRSLGSDAPPNSGTVPKALHMEWVDKLAMDTLTVNAQDYFQKLEPWVMRAQDLANVTSYREWVLFGYLVCPDELLRVTCIDIAMVVLKEHLVLTLFRDEDAADPTIGFLLDGKDKLCHLVRKYMAAIKGYALSYLSSSAGRIRFLLGTPGMVALDIDSTLKNLFQQDLRKYWLSILMIVTSSRSSINIRHLEKATVSTGKEGLLSEGNAAYNWSRCVDELESQLARHGSLMKLYFYHHHLTAVFRNTMFGPEGRPQHCCAWLGVASSFPECASAIVPDELNKVGRDSILYVESLIESIMGGLEGLINILDSEGGFGSLEMQLVPEQAAFCLNNVLKGSTASFKSPKGWSMQKPGYESYPENTSSVKMLEAAMQRLTNLCSVLNDMEPVCVLNHVFVLREYMRECILGNFRRRLLAVMITDNCLQRPSIIESLLQRHIGIIHMAEQHISMDITEGIREVLLTESFTGPVSYLQKFEKPTEMQTGSAIELVGNWYLENIVKDISGAGVLFIPIRHCFKSSQVIGACTAESYTDVRELKALIRIFGGYGFDRIDRLLKEHTAALLNCIDTALRSNREALEGLAGSVNYGDRIEREANIKQLLDLDTLVGFCIQAGQAIAFHKLLVEAAGAVLEENAPLILSLLRGVANQLPVDIPEKDDITRLRRLANTVGADEDHDTEWIHAIMAEVGVANDSSWSFLPYLCSAFMASNIWSMTTYNVNTGGFNNNVHCLARCINAVIAGSEYVRMERVQEPRSLSNGHAGEISEPETLNRTSVEANIKSALQIFVKCSAGIVLDSWSENSRTYIVPKLIFLDQLCELSRYLPRSTLEIHIPYTILRSIYRQHYGNSATMITELLAPSPRQSPLISLTHASPAVRPHRGDSTPMPYDPGYLSSSIHRHDDAHEGDSLRLKTSDKQQRNTRSSGPLEYSSSRKVKFAEGSSSGGQGPSPLLRFAVSRSGPLSYK
ncbi:Membrane-associated apoptosis protein, partial [Musa troglodytarum]